ncbi:hypothetical protein [Bosea sp. LC85]|uniref:hypothetical protein n=1 Tax=Bosea sp. LC85 TaxID=1502851 RepID=UPI0005BD5C50|nr:hypothetical protein [Bosea sp. LC85]
MLSDDVAQARKRLKARSGVVLKINSMIIHDELGVDLDVEEILGLNDRNVDRFPGSAQHQDPVCDQVAVADPRFPSAGKALGRQPSWTSSVIAARTLVTA